MYHRAHAALGGMTQDEYNEADIAIRKARLQMDKRAQWWEAASPVGSAIGPFATLFGILAAGSVLERFQLGGKR